LLTQIADISTGSIELLQYKSAMQGTIKVAIQLGS